MPKIIKRTDLALESAQEVEEKEGLPEGISVEKRSAADLFVTEVGVMTEEAAGRIGKPVGRYVTVETPERFERRPENFDERAGELAREIRRLIGGGKRVLVAGLGNSEITPDSLGPRVCSHIFATRHIKCNAPELMEDGLGEVSAVIPGVMGQTGIEAGELIKRVCGEVEPEAVIAVDALACSEISHLGRTVQLTDTGISPGSGVLNSRKELSEKTLGVPCLAIGVPTIADLGEEEEGEPLMVTPRSVDKLISGSAQLLAAAINLALHPGLSLEEIMSLTS